MEIWLLTGGAALAGLIAGSLTTALADRLVDGRNWWLGRSSCDHCQKRLAVLELIPVLSYLGQAGRCRSCGQAISWHYPVVELAGGAGFGLFYYFQFGGLQFSHLDWLWLVIWALVLTGLLLLAVIDWRHWILPTPIIVIIFGLLLVGRLIETGSEGVVWPDQLLTAGSSLMAGGGLFYLIYRCHPAGLGFGDVRLATVLGLLIFDPFLCLAMVTLAGLLGLAGFAVSWSVKAGRPAKIPFGPCLIVAALIVFLAAEPIGRHLNPAGWSSFGL